MAKVPVWMFRQSAVIPYRRGPNGLEVLLVTSRKGKHWVLPKGVVEPDLTPAVSAEKEAMEEAGVRGAVDDEPLGTYEYRK
jgi:phosphohistidine phosphatase